MRALMTRSAAVRPPPVASPVTAPTDPEMAENDDRPQEHTAPHVR